MRRLTAEQEAELATLIKAGPDIARDGIVRWRCVDLQQLILTRWNVAYHKRTIGKLLRRLASVTSRRSEGLKPLQSYRSPAFLDDLWRPA